MKEIIRLIEFIIIFIIVFVAQDYVFKLQVKQVIEENPNITLQEFMGDDWARKEVEKYENNRRV